MGVDRWLTGDCQGVSEVANKSRCPQCHRKKLPNPVIHSWSSVVEVAKHTWGCCQRRFRPKNFEENSE